MPKKNVVLERFHFNNLSQGDQEDFDRFVTRIKNQAASCEFGDLKDQLIRDRVVVGIKNKSVQERMLREKDLDLNKAITIAKTAEVTKHHLQQLHEFPTVSTVSEVTKKKSSAQREKNIYQKFRLNNRQKNTSAGDVTRPMKVRNAPLMEHNVINVKA